MTLGMALVVGKSHLWPGTTLNAVKIPKDTTYWWKGLMSNMNLHSFWQHLLSVTFNMQIKIYWVTTAHFPIFDSSNEWEECISLKLWILTIDPMYWMTSPPPPPNQTLDKIFFEIDTLHDLVFWCLWWK